MTEKLPPTILVIAQDDLQNVSLCNNIERFNFNTVRAKNINLIAKAISNNLPDLAIISSTVQNISLVEDTSKLRKVSGLEKIPVIFLLDQEEIKEEYKILGNDFIKIISKPFIPNDLVNEIRLLLKKSNAKFQDKFISYRDIVMDLSSYKVFRNKKPIHLGPTEFKILQLFVTNPNKILSRDRIIEYAWNSDKKIENRTVDVHINRLRKAISTSIHEELILTIRSSGYFLN